MKVTHAILQGVADIFTASKARRDDRGFQKRCGRVAPNPAYHSQPISAIMLRIISLGR